TTPPVAAPITGGTSSSPIVENGAGTPTTTFGGVTNTPATSIVGGVVNTPATSIGGTTGAGVLNTPATTLGSSTMNTVVNGGATAATGGAVIPPTTEVAGVSVGP